MSERQSSKSPKVNVPSENLSADEFCSVMASLAAEYKTTLPDLIDKLDSVSGNLERMDLFYTEKDQKMLWTSEEDQLLKDGKVEFLKKWKGP